MTVQQFIDKLQALPEDIKQLPVYVSTTFCSELDGEEELGDFQSLEDWILDLVEGYDYTSEDVCKEVVKYPKRFHIGA